MNIVDFPNCCGAKVLTGLYEETTPEESLKALKAKIMLAKTYHSVGLLTAISNPDQLHFGRLLYACGFRRIRKFINPLHKSELKLWALDLNTVKQEALEAVALPNNYIQPEEQEQDGEDD